MEYHALCSTTLGEKVVNDGDGHRPTDGYHTPTVCAPLVFAPSRGARRARWDAVEMLAWHQLDVKTLFVASAGGHLEELWLLRKRFEVSSEDCMWITWETEQSRSLLQGEQRLFVKKSEPHDVRSVLGAARTAAHVLALGPWSRVISTGSLLAVPFISLARARGIPSYYIESAARVSGPSLAARVLERVPGVHRYSQHRSWAGDRSGWDYRGSVFDGFVAESRPAAAIRRIVVTVGTNGFDFRRLIEKLTQTVPASTEVLWQVGATDVSTLPVDGHTCLPEAQFFDAMRASDLVIAHAGVGSALSAMRAGHRPILVPRRSHYGEHVDDHQVEIASELAGRGLAISCDVADIEWRALVDNAAGRVIPNPHAPEFLLDAG
jgi:UDP-N-acetylglucosamine--N-acetylmuramyl-(pentapeptide) pyrophosphoryl-undecaprenol N-acetylglucosamine transferase